MHQLAQTTAVFRSCMCVLALLVWYIGMSSCIDGLSTDRGDVPAQRISRGPGSCLCALNLAEDNSTVL